jgi:hypothetical protein
VQRNPTTSGAGSTQPTKINWPRIKPTPTFEMKFHTSNRLGRKGSPSDQIKKLKRKIEYRTTEYRMSKQGMPSFLLKGQSEAIP